MQLDELAGIGRKMPLTMAAFTIAGFGLVGTPGTAGFISKWYLAVGALEKGWWVAGLPDRGKLADRARLCRPRARGRLVARAVGGNRANASDPPLSMLLPLVVLAAATIYFGIDTEWTAGIASTGRQGPARRAAMTRVLRSERLVLAGDARRRSSAR